MSEQSPLDLILVMPVYNEEECISQVVREWHSVLASTGARFAMLVLNDGSTDRTAEELASLADLPGLQVINKPNSGHGPTILHGYREAVRMAEWVFQTDSDGEMPATAFRDLWDQHNAYDALFGVRMGRSQPLARKIISAVSRVMVRLLFGPGVADVNTPYRLMRSSLLRPIVAQIPADTFAPNVIISGVFARWGCRILNVPVPHSGRRTGRVSLMRWKMWRAAFRAARQTLACRPSRSEWNAC